MKVQAHTPQMRSNINITPLIDIVLVLLIVFIIMVPGMMKALEASLPQVSRGPGEGDTRALVVSLLADGSLKLQQADVDRAQLQAQLVPALLKQPYDQRRVVLKVDGSLPHGRAVEAMDLVRRADEEARRRSVAELGVEGREARVVMAQLK